MDWKELFAVCTSCSHPDTISVSLYIRSTIVLPFIVLCDCASTLNWPKWGVVLQGIFSFLFHYWLPTLPFSSPCHLSTAMDLGSDLAENNLFSAGFAWQCWRKGNIWKCKTCRWCRRQSSPTPFQAISPYLGSLTEIAKLLPEWMREMRPKIRLKWVADLSVQSLLCIVFYHAIKLLLRILLLVNLVC